MKYALPKKFLILLQIHSTCMQDTFSRARTRPMQLLGQARATIGYIAYKHFAASIPICTLIPKQSTRYMETIFT